MARLTDAELLTKIKTGLGITTAYQDDTLKIYIDDVKAFMLSAGVKQSVIASEAAVGCILRGVADLWNYGSGNATLSEYFRMRVIQLTYEEEESKAVMTYSLYTPAADEATMYGWNETIIGLAKNLNRSEFTVDDTQNISVTVKCADGSVYTGENTGTGNRRYITVNNKRIVVMPKTIYDAEQTKFVDNDNITCITIPKDFCESIVVIETYEKAV